MWPCCKTQDECHQFISLHKCVNKSAVLKTVIFVFYVFIIIRLEMGSVKLIRPE